MRISALFLLAMFAAAPVTADELNLQESTDAQPVNFALPHRGESMGEVVHQFGEPKTKLRPVGGETAKHPPITRWEYAGFIVYFEHTHVIKAVVPDHPPAISHVDQLQPGT